MTLGVNLIPTAVAKLEKPRVKQRWPGPAEALDLIILYQAADLVICSFTTITWKFSQKARPRINVQHLLLSSAGKAEVVLVTGKLGFLMRNRERLYNSHKKSSIRLFLQWPENIVSWRHSSSKRASLFWGK